MLVGVLTSVLPRYVSIFEKMQLAPAFILAAGHDPLVDQGRAYAAVLSASGVPVRYCS
mgnify:CR=1 FL=1